MSTEKTISYKGIYWWSDAENVTSILEEELKKILGTTRISSIQIEGTDFNDGRENHKISITVSDGKIVVEQKP